MIGQLNGKLLEKHPPMLLLDVNGVGYEVNASMATFYDLPEVGQESRLFTHLLVREDALTLYGFSTAQERTFFLNLIKINGVGAKLALAILSGISLNDFVCAVQNDDITTLVKLPGIGKKTAERLIVEMRDKISTWANTDSMDTDKNPISASNSIPDSAGHDAIEALISLGYKRVQAEKMVKSLDQQGQSSEDLIKLALKNSLGAV